MIIQGSNGVVLKLYLNEMDMVDGINLNINSLVLDSTINNITVTIQSDTNKVTKIANIVDTIHCEVILNSTDLIDVGTYKIQATVNYQNGDSFSSEIATFKVGEKL